MINTHSLVCCCVSGVTGSVSERGGDPTLMGGGMGVACGVVTVRSLKTLIVL